jgi:hypothetical protein
VSRRSRAHYFTPLPATKTRPPLRCLTWYGKDKAHWQATGSFPDGRSEPSARQKKALRATAKSARERQNRPTATSHCWAELRKRSPLPLVTATTDDTAASLMLQESTTGEPVQVPLTALTTSASSAAVRMLHTIAVPAPPTTEMTVERHNAAESYCFTALTTGSLPANMPNRLRGAKPPRCSVVEELPVCSRMICSGKPESAIPVRPHIKSPLQCSIVTVL